MEKEKVCCLPIYYRLIYHLLLLINILLILIYLICISSNTLGQSLVSHNSKTSRTGEQSTTAAESDSDDEDEQNQTETYAQYAPSKCKSCYHLR